MSESELRSDTDARRTFHHDLAGALTPLLVEVQLLLQGDAMMDAEVREALQEVEKLALRMREQTLKNPPKTGETPVMQTPKDTR